MDYPLYNQADSRGLILFNLNVHPVIIQDGKLGKSLPGLFTLVPPRKCARGRESDQLAGLIQLTGQTSITPDALQDWLLSKAAQFYKIPGTVTSAMRFLAESINSELLERNAKRAGDGSQVNGSLCLIVIRRNVVFTLVIGQARIFVLSNQDAFEYEDRENHPRGLGVVENIVCRFAQTEVTENAAILLAPQVNRAWSVESLRGGALLSIDSLARRIFNQAPPTLTGALIRLTAGNGQVSYSPLRSAEAFQDNTSTNLDSERKTEASVSEPRESPEAKEPITTQSSVTISQLQQKEIVKQVDLPLPAENERQDTAPVQDLSPAATPIDRRRPSDKTEQLKRTSESAVTSAEIKAQVGSYAKAVDDFQNKAKKGISQFLVKLLPGSTGESPALPQSVLLITAIAVPILVVALASFVYFRKGASQQFDLYFQQGQLYAAQAQSLVDDPAGRLANLQQALYFLEKASEFGQSDDSNLLRSQIQTELDSMQGIVRLNVTPISSIGLAENVNITQMAATATDLYLLDSISGRALRFYLSGAEYVQDPEFDCGPNPENPLSNIGKLVDILPLPAGSSFNATLLAIDAVGNIEFCNPGDSGAIVSLIPPDAGWRQIRSISLDDKYLYVLDPEMNAVYRYQEVEESYSEKPTLYFDNVVPTLTNAIDIEVNGDELYILRSTSEMVECTYSHMKDYKLTECTDPAPYGDMRTGESPRAISFPDAQFIQMRMTSAPDSSLYLLDANGRNLYHFSLQRNLQKILHPGFLDEGFAPDIAPTAVAVSPAKIVFLAYGSQIYHAALP